MRAAVVDGRAGFRRHHSHEVVLVEQCLVAHPWAEQILTEGFFGEAREVTIRVGAATGERLVVVTPSAQGVVVPDGGAGRPGGASSLAVVGTDELSAGHRAWIHEEVAGRRWRISALSFFQTRPDGAAALAEAVVRAAGADLAGARVVDAYSGVGLLAGSLFSLGPRGRRRRPASLVAVERSTLGGGRRPGQPGRARSTAARSGWCAPTSTAGTRRGPTWWWPTRRGPVWAAGPPR